MRLTNLNRVAHQKLRVLEEPAFSACKDVTMCAVTLSEIPRLVIEYPVAFTKGDEKTPIIPVALFGVGPEQNLYWRDDRWNSVGMPGDSLAHALEGLERYGSEVISQYTP